MPNNYNNLAKLIVIRLNEANVLDVLVEQQSVEQIVEETIDDYFEGEKTNGPV